MKKYGFLLILTFVTFTIFGAVFTLIQIFYYKSIPLAQEFIFPLVISSIIGIVLGLWCLKLKNYKEVVEAKIAIRTAELRKNNEDLKKENLERKRVEKALKESEWNLNRAQKLAKISSWHYDMATKTEVWSDECFKIYGLKKENYPDNIVPDGISMGVYERPDVGEQINNFITSRNDTFVYEFTTVPINGEVKYIQSFCEVEKDEDGSIIKVFGTEQDVTESKRREEQLIKAKEQAEIANNSKTEFLANISHELRTPMQGINGYSNLAIEKFKTTKKAKLLEYFEEISLCGDRLLTLVDDLLDLSKLESGKTEYKFEEVGISLLILSVINEILPLMKQKKISIDFKEPHQKITALIDEKRISQVISNIFSNAIKFSKPDSSISVELLVNENSFEVSISDEGVGIPENELKSIFNKFTQSTKTKTGAGGTGLGLAICLEIIKVHNGKIWVENNTLLGSTFRFELPCQQE